MLAAIITLSLLSLLVATEAEPANSPTDHSPGGEPLRPSGGFSPGRSPDKTDRLAA